ARIAAVLAPSLSLPKIMGIGPIIITPPVLISVLLSFAGDHSLNGVSESGVLSKRVFLPNASVLFECDCVDLDSWYRLRAIPIRISRNPISITRIPIEKSIFPSINVSFSIGIDRELKLLIQAPAYL